MRVLLSSIITGSEEIEMIANFLPILGVPFLLISWIMLLKMGYSLIEVPMKNNLLRIHGIIFILIIPIAWGLYALLDKTNLQIGMQLAYTQIGLTMFIELLYMSLFASVVLKYAKKQSSPNTKIMTRFTMLMLLGLILRIAVLPFYFSSPWILALLILIYFLSNSIPLFYLKLNSDFVFRPVHAENPIAKKKALIYEKYQITKREREIVEQICQGKTNQQIADELFISLQTVKDHTHRIYTKIGINGRMKLVQLVNAY
jgi:DNA-binding CsgD family transcriptional regulator